MKRPLSMQARIGLTLAAALLLFAVSFTLAVAYYVLVPVGKRAAEDFAALIVLSAQTWVELPPATRPAFEREALRTHHLRISLAGDDQPALGPEPPYIHFLGEALQRLLGDEVRIMRDRDDRRRYLVDVAVGGRVLRLGFSEDRIGTQLPSAILVVALAGIGISLLASVLFARRLTRPLQQLSAGAEVVGQGGRHQPLRETGPRELASLVRSFNRMAVQVEELLSNRTTLLAGISHDLRTPLARMSLAAELLPSATDPELVEGLRRDIEEMSHLIGQVMELARGLEPEPGDLVDLRDVVEGVVSDFRRSGLAVDWRPDACCPRQVPVAALRRVLTNLLDNARRYAGSRVVAIRCECDESEARISVLDRGPGIPESQRRAIFRPFHRVEASRSRATGGSGLGLAIVAQICAAHGWRIEALERDGGGAELRLTLPARTEPA